MNNDALFAALGVDAVAAVRGYRTAVVTDAARRGLVLTTGALTDPARTATGTRVIDPVDIRFRTGWFGPGGSQVGSTAIALQATGVLDPRPAPLGDVVVRAAASTAAAVRIVPGGAPATARDGVAALLRYR